MPAYQLIVLCRPDVTPDKLASCFRGVARVVYREHGQFRAIKNYGVRPLAFPIRKLGQRFDEARWVHATFDAAPPVLAAVGAAVQSEKAVLQYKHLRLSGGTYHFDGSAKGPKTKRFTAAMRYDAAKFDPAALTPS